MFTSKNIIFSTFRNCFILHGHVFVMQASSAVPPGLFLTVSVTRKRLILSLCGETAFSPINSQFESKVSLIIGAKDFLLTLENFIGTHIDA